MATDVLYQKKITRQNWAVVYHKTRSKILHTMV